MSIVLRSPGRFTLVALALAHASPVLAAPAQTLDRAREAMVVDPHQVIRLVGVAREELGAAVGRRAALDRARADWLEAEAHGRLGELDQADRLSAKALGATRRLQSGGRLHGDILMTRGAIALDRGEVKRAFELFRAAHGIFHTLGETRSEAIALQNIGSIYGDAGDQRNVLRYYAQAAEVHPGDTALAQAAANNLGTAYRELKDWPKADASFRKALALARRLGSPVLETRALNNLAAVSLLRGRLAEAERYADRGLRLAAEPAVREWAPFLWGVKAQIALAYGNLGRGTALLDRTFASVKLEQTPIYFRDFHASAVDAYRRSGRPELALRHLAALKRLDDEAREIRSSTNAALSAAQFDFSSQELRIARLREGQLERDVAIERARARQQWLLLAGTLLLLAVATAAFLWVRRSRNETRVANRQLATTNLALDKALKAKSEFLATTSHEIRTPLNGILGMTQLLLRRRALEPEVQDQVRLIDSAGNTMKAIVDDILDMSQIEQGQVQVDRAPVALPALMQDVAGLWRAAAAQKGLAFEVDVSAAPACVEEDERKLRQIGFNLLSNAVKFTREGKVCLRVSTTAEPDAEWLRVEVEDTGIGIPADQHDAIFEPFKQADGSTSREFGGTGLGLAISTKLADALGGRITVESAPGAGSTFTLLLPLRRVVTQATSGSPRLADTLASACVAIVEENPLFASMTEACLGAAREVILVEGEDALPAHADVVVLCGDVTAERVEAARARAQGARLVILGQPSAEAAADAVLPRTMPPLGLGDAIEALLSNAPAQAEAA